MLLEFDHMQRSLLCPQTITRRAGWSRVQKGGER